MDDETHYRLLKLIGANPEMSQRDLADAMGISLGKVNYCLRAIIVKGLVKVKNFKVSQNKRAYAYYLTPRGIEKKALLTSKFLKKKLNEYRELRLEIEKLRREAAQLEKRGEMSSEIFG